MKAIVSGVGRCTQRLIRAPRGSGLRSRVPQTQYDRKEPRGDAVLTRKLEIFHADTVYSILAGKGLSLQYR